MDHKAFRDIVLITIAVAAVSCFASLTRIAIAAEQMVATWQEEALR